MGWGDSATVGFHSLSAPVYPQLPRGCIQPPITAGVVKQSKVHLASEVYDLTVLDRRCRPHTGNMEDSDSYALQPEMSPSAPASCILPPPQTEGRKSTYFSSGSLSLTSSWTRTHSHAGFEPWDGQS